MSTLAQLVGRSESRSTSSQVETRFDPEYGVYWGFMNPTSRPCFSPQLLGDLADFVQSIAKPAGVMIDSGVEYKINYAVIASRVPGIFNLGGDLALFKQAVLAEDRDALVRYGRKCIDNQYPWYCNFGLPMTTISLVQGEALGGGFECALSSSVIVAEESSRMGFPEILFNLFPGMGAYSFLVRRAGRRIAEEMISGGTIYTARQLYDMGIVDVITPDGTGEAAVYSYIKKHAKAANARHALESVRNRLDPLSFEELLRVVEIWADTALKLDSRDLKMMDRLLRAQQRSQTDLRVAAAIAATDNVVRLGAVAAGGSDD